ncbi:MAG: metal-sensitive transcriptional regulator [Rhodanobacteraceae bacterium]
MRRTIPPPPLTQQPRSFRPSRLHASEASMRHDHQHPEEERSALWLRKVAGQLKAIDRMIEEDRDCAEILTQLVSARKRIKSLSEKLIHSHAHNCIENAASPRDAKKKLRQLLVVLKRYVE